MDTDSKDLGVWTKNIGAPKFKVGDEVILKFGHLACLQKQTWDEMFERGMVKTEIPINIIDHPDKSRYYYDLQPERAGTVYRINSVFMNRDFGVMYDLVGDGGFTRKIECEIDLSQNQKMANFILEK